MKTGIELIAEKRQEQIEKHNRDINYDVKNNNHYQLSEAAGLLTMLDMDEAGASYEEMMPTDWSIDLWTKMCMKLYEDRLVIAGALIAAEIDRLQRIN